MQEITAFAVKVNFYAGIHLFCKEVSASMADPKLVPPDPQSPEAILASLPYLRRIKDIAERIGIKDRTLYHYARTGEIGYYMVGGSIMLDLREVAEWLRRAYHPPTRTQSGGQPPQAELPAEEPSANGHPSTDGKARKKEDTL